MAGGIKQDRGCSRGCQGCCHSVVPSRAGSIHARPARIARSLLQAGFRISGRSSRTTTYYRNLYCGIERRKERKVHGVCSACVFVWAPFGSAAHQLQEEAVVGGRMAESLKGSSACIARTKTYTTLHRDGGFFLRSGTWHFDACCLLLALVHVV